MEVSRWPTGRGRPINDGNVLLGHVWVDKNDALEQVGGTYVKARIWAEFLDGEPATVQEWKLDRAADGQPIGVRRREREVRPIMVDRGPALRMYLEVRDGRLDVRACEFVTDDDDRGVRYQDINWARKKWTELMMFAVMATPVCEKSDDGYQLIVDEQRALSDLQNVGMKKNNKWDDRALRRLAGVYLACKDGEPVGAVQDEFNLKKPAADKAIDLARRKNFLPPAPVAPSRGKAGS